MGYLMELPNPKESFQCAIPMRHIFGFVDDYSKVTYGMRDTLQLICKGDKDALFRTAGADVGKVVLSKLAWSVPIVQPNDVRKVNLYKSIAANNAIPVSFRIRQCEAFFLPQARSTVYFPKHIRVHVEEKHTNICKNKSLKTYDTNYAIIKH